MSQLQLKQNDDYDKILHISIKLVVLQNLRICYFNELDQDLPQETKNFRSCCILDEIKLILDNLVPYIQWLANIDSGDVIVNKPIRDGVDKLIPDLDEYYQFTLEEVRKKEERLRLINLERSIFANEQ